MHILSGRQVFLVTGEFIPRKRTSSRKLAEEKEIESEEFLFLIKCFLTVFSYSLYCFSISLGSLEDSR